MAWPPTDHLVGAAAVLRCIEIGAPQDVAGIADTLDLHPNTVRKHLVRLEEAGVVVQSVERTGTAGRPRHVYRPSTPVQPEPFARLALLLATLNRSGRSPRDVGRDAGAVAALDVDADSPAIAVAVVTRAHGLHAIVDSDDVVIITGCPFDPSSAGEAATICDLHLGLVEGAAAARGAIATFDSIEPSVRCRIRVRPDGDGRGAVGVRRAGSARHTSR